MANALENEIRMSFQALGWFYLRIPVASTESQRFLKQAPFDFMAVTEGVPVAIECKMIKDTPSAGLPSFPIDRLPPHQIEALEKFSKNGGKAFIVISVRKKRGGLTWAISIEDWLELTRDLDRKSIPGHYLTTKSEFIELDRVNYNSIRMWDLRKLTNTNKKEQTDG